MEIKLLVLDVDGTLTDGKIYMSATGELMKAFNIKDGYALAHLRDFGIDPVIITGRKSEIVTQRCKELNIQELHQGVSNKLFCLRKVCDKYNTSLSQVAYIGDDVNDLLCMHHCGLSACPSDAITYLKERVDYVCESKGGDGAVRKFVDYIIKQTSQVQNYPEYPEIQEIHYELDQYNND